MDRNIKTRMSSFVQEKIVKRKAMFIPIAGVATFMLVGYAAVDKEKPEIVSNEIEVSYGEAFDLDAIDIKDNRDNRSDITVTADLASLDVNQLGEYNVEVTATDTFSNATTKTIKVNVVDQVGPEFNILGSNDGYYVSVPVNGSNDIASYISATDNVDGDVTPFITSDKALDTTALGYQTLKLTATDASGNETTKTFGFAVSDTEAPVINLLQGENAVANYGEAFDLSKFVTVTDNFDTVTPVVDGTVDTKNENNVQTLTISATDASSNTSKATLNITVRDIQAPTISLKKSSVSVNAGGSLDFASYLSSATDNKDGDLTSKVSVPSVDLSKAGTKTATYTVTDAAGNQGSASIEVTVKKVASTSVASGKVPGNYNGSSIVGAAYSRLGCPYVYGASGPNTFDCSGLVQWCYAKAGKSLPHSSGGIKSAGTAIPVSQAQPGDVLWKSGHVGIYIGGGQYIHAPRTGDVVKISSDIGRFTCAVRF